MRNAVIASAAMMATSALAQGTAHVVNACKYDVYMANTPAQGGGFEPINECLKPGGSYSQQWTELSNGMGWSIKLAKTDSYQTNLLQYEYTFHDDGIIWYDLSQVDGNPWDGDWMITASGNCNPKQQAYRYSTDDAYGMQSCPDQAEITVTLCSGEDQADPIVSSQSAGASSPAETGSAWSETSQAPSTTSGWGYGSGTAAATEPAKTHTGKHNGGGFSINTNGMVAKAAEITPSPTTLVTKQISTSDAGDYDVTVTDVVTEVATAYVTAGARRHAHHPHQRAHN